MWQQHLPPHVLVNPSSSPPTVLVPDQWRLRSLEKNPEGAGWSLWAGASSVAGAFTSPSPSSPSSCSSSDWSSSSKSSTSLSDSSASSSSLVDSGTLDRCVSSLSAVKPTAASILSWMAAVTAAAMTSPAIWLTNSRALSAGRSLWEAGECLDLIGCWGWGEGRPRLRSSSSSPFVVVPLSSEGNSGRPPVNASSLSRSVRWKRCLFI